MTTRRDLLRAGLHLAALPLGAFAAPAVAARARITTTSLKPGIWLLDGAGCNVLALRGPEGALLVDGGYAEHSKVLLQAAARATGTKRVAGQPWPWAQITKPRLRPSVSMPPK